MTPRDPRTRNTPARDTRARESPLWRRYARLWGPDPRADMEDEFAFHVRERTDELIASGMDARQAREEVMRGFGDIDRVKAICLGLAKERQDAMRKQEQWNVLWQDVVYAFRQMRAQPLLTFAALLTLAVGIGATTSIFSVVYAVLLRPLPYTDSDRLAIVSETVGEQTGRASAAHFRDWTEQSTTLEATAAWVSRNYNLTGSGEPERLGGAAVSPTWFDVLHMPPAAGRYFMRGDDAPGSRVTVLSYELWQTRFAGDRGIIGRTIHLNGEAYTVIGVTPAGFRLTEFDEQLWTTLVIPPAEQGNYESHGLFVAAKLKPGVTRDAAQADLERVTEGIRQRQPKAMVNRGVRVATWTDTLFGYLRTQLLVLLGAVVFVLLIACGNVASLLLARATTRRKELAIRAALGGGRPRLIRQLLTESVVLAGSGGALGVLFAWFGVQSLVSAAPPGVPRLADAGLNVEVVLFALGATLLCGVLFGLAPALRATRTDLQKELREGGKTSRGSGARDRLRSVLVVGEIAVALVLVVGAGLFIRSAQLVQRVPLGFDAEGVTMARVTLPQERYSAPEVTTATYARMLEELRAQPGVSSAGFGTRAPMWGGSTDIGLTLRNFPRPREEMQIAHVRLVSDGYFETLRIPLRRGRMLQASDMRPSAPPVVVMNETLARQSFGETDPIGQLVTGWNGPDGVQVWREVVGVVGDVRAFGREAETPPELFFPYSQMPHTWQPFQRSVALLVRADGGADVVPGLRTAVRTIDPSLALFDVRLMSDVLALTFSGRRFNMLLLTILGVTGLVLAAVGIYGVVGFFVLQRTQEIGLRMALGATAGDVLRLVMSHGSKLTVLGILLGAAASFWITRVLASMLYEVNARDPLTFVSGAVVLGVTAVLAALVPARRATRVEPLRSLSEQ
jgi:putative ABC transport system permease protein